MRAHRLLFYLLKLYHSANWQSKTSDQTGRPFPAPVYGQLAADAMPRNRLCDSERVQGGYTGDAVGEAVPTGVFRFLTPGFHRGGSGPEALMKQAK